MKRYSTSYVTREMKIKAKRYHQTTTQQKPRRYYYIPTGMAKNRTKDKCWWECGAMGTLIRSWWKCKMAQPLWRLVVSYKTKHTPNVWYRNCTPRYLAKVDENLCPHKTLITDVYRSFIHNCQNLKEATKMSFNRYMDKQTMVRPDNRILSSTKKECSIKP